MEKSTARNVVFYVALDASAYDHLSTLRKWTNLEMGKEADTIWLKNLNYDQINSRELLQIPFVKRYYAKQGQLFLYQHLLPERSIPEIIWQNLDRQTAITLPDYNFNYFDSSEKLVNKIVPSKQEKPSAALLTTLPVLLDYMVAAPAVRYQHLKWVLINYETVFLLGTPLLPIPGTAIWQNGRAFIPAGYDFELPVFTKVLTQKLIGTKDRLLIWNEDGNYFFINHEDLNQLNLAAVRKQQI